ncbi:MAG: glycosyltransferase [Alphaproteobacteria bacterium]
MALSRSLNMAKRRLAHAIEAAMAPRSGDYDNPTADPTIAGLFGAASGIGESARLCVDALRGLGIETDTIDLSDALHQNDIHAERYQTTRSGNAGPLIIHLNPPELPRALRLVGRQRLAGRKIIGYWAWELPEAPASWLRAMQYVHEVWTPSGFCTAALSTGATVPVRTVPHILPELPPVVSGTADRDVEFHVIAGGDARSSLARKNLEGALLAFRNAFGDDPAVRLSIRLGHGSSTDPVVAAFERRCAAHQNVRLLEDTVDEAGYTRFIASADVVISLHRSEGFGLVLAKAMRMGLPVIATGWSGNMEFMTAQTACLVGFEATDVHDPQGIYPGAGQHWAEPDLDAASTWLKRLRSDPELRTRIGENAARAYPAGRFQKMLRDALGR